MGRVADASAGQDGRARQRAVFTNGSASTTMPTVDTTDDDTGTTFAPNGTNRLLVQPGPDVQQELVFGVPVRWWRVARSFLCTMYLLMGAGIIYLFSSYGTQLRDRFGYSQLQVSMVASSANLGLYLSGPGVGWLIDRYGPRPVAIVGSLMMFFGFLAVSTAVNSQGVMFPAWLLCGLYFFVGSGSSGCTLPSIALNVRAFPAHVRGFAVGVPLSLYGLSAFIFVQIKSAYFDADSSADAALTGGDLGGFLTTITAFLGVGVFLALVAMWDVPLDENGVESIVIATDEQGSDEEEAVAVALTAAPHKIQGLGEYLTFRSSQCRIPPVYDTCPAIPPTARDSTVATVQYQPCLALPAPHPDSAVPAMPGTARDTVATAVSAMPGSARAPGATAPPAPAGGSVTRVSPGVSRRQCHDDSPP
ncbi:hypothetical protein AMAG_12099 [Allomyces macrogynus ATCC 38327]|uniref:Nodulin-like domain-containing protein n=1 Tax=Allomyces macrogynus (strain ATCC 38327) TaxID=578462 RepID=A0A0L0SX23_ALLM3|nr:hypothetical protein AMAG_12099 [Allomyces macrogynus ATCC 38327]|eukprot:KNE67021.1 hypothetical protein AMAG_12099 [Allomyces macrogynus ATCC 38327]